MNYRKEPAVDLSCAAWHKSVHSHDNGCVEVAFVNEHVAIRDSKDPSGPTLVFTPLEWIAFLGGVRDGQFNLPS